MNFSTVLNEICREPHRKTLLIVPSKKELRPEYLPVLERHGATMHCADQSVLGETFKAKYDKIVCYNVSLDNRFMTCMQARLLSMEAKVKSIVFIFD